MTNNNSTNPVNTLALSFQTTLSASLTQQRTFQVQGLRALWQQIAEAFFVAQNIKGQDKAHLKAALDERNIKEAAKDANPYLPIVKLLYGEWNAKDATLFEPNRSAEKYACVFRYFDKRKNEYPDVASIVDHIEETFGNLKGIEEMDRQDHRKKTSVKASSEEELKRGLSVRGGMEIGSTEDVAAIVAEFPTDAQQGQVWFKVEGGKVYLMGFKPLADDARNNLAKKRGKVLITKAANAAINAELTPSE